MPALRPGMVVADVAGEALAYDPYAKKAHRINAAGARVLRRCDGESSTGEVARDLVAGSGLSTEAGREAVRHHLLSLKRAGLLEPGASLPRGPGRREFLARWGRASAALLPVIATLAIPAPAHAQSQGCPVCPDTAGCFTIFGMTRLNVCCTCGLGGACPDPNTVCSSAYIKGGGGGTSCQTDTILGVACATPNGASQQHSCAAARAAVADGEQYACCLCP
ncbi:MAG: hypothetical protein K8I02_00680 [Candidatus Methylomirabilis sp.]|nr:hypothetical protein [Deltaproteobacteria bacterium]